MALLIKMASGFGVLEHCKISNSKHQITNKFQIPILNDQNRFGISNFGHCDLPFDLAQGGELVEPFDICDLEFQFLHYSSRLPQDGKDH